MSDFDIFDDDGELAIPTERGSANLDVQDYQQFDGHSDLLDDDLQEDTRSTPGSGAGPATDIDGTDDLSILVEETGPGMEQTTYGDHPWGAGSSTGYRPHSQQRTDMSLRGGDDHTPSKIPQDDMSREPEVINAEGAAAIEPWAREWHGNRNQMPSNADIDPETLYDRSSYERDGSSNNVIGGGIFDMEEGVTWRARDGIFADQYALPAYIGDEDELGVQQSDMWDPIAQNWRVTQPSASGVTLKVRTARNKSPPPVSSMRPEVTGPRSHVEAFGRKAAQIIMRETSAVQPLVRGQFIAAAVDTLGPQMSARCRSVADRLVELGYPREVALEDALAHCVMHAVVKDLTAKKKKATSALPRLDRLASKLRFGRKPLESAAIKHLAPLTQNAKVMARDLGALFGSPAARGLGQVTAADSGATTAALSPVATPSPGIFTVKNAVIVGGVGLVGWFLFSNRKSIVKNLKKLVR
jgi:hypothetical protein